MSRGQNPLVLMMALSLPGAAHALGLGEIHVNSALNEPLAADIEIVGATPEELSSLTASVANRETFLRFGAERPAFLASATFKVSRDLKGKPVLVIRSKDSFTEPVVNLLVDLRWHSGEVIRQYSLLLDPAGFPAAPQVAAAVRSPAAPPAALVLPVPAAAAITTTSTAAAPIDAAAPLVPAAPPAAAARLASAGSTASAAPSTRTTTHMKIGAKATLRGIAWRVGARSDSDLKKTMLAIFRANPHAFEGNINRLRLGAVLTIPAAADISSISKEDAGREIRAQMTAWRASPPKTRAAAAAAAQPMAAAVQPVAAPAQEMPPQARGMADAAASADTAALNLRVQSLEQGLHDVQAQLEREHNKLLTVQSEVRYAEQTAKDPVAATPAPSSHWLLTSLTAGLALLAGAWGTMFLKRRRAMPKATAAKSAPAGGASMPDESAHLADKPVAQPAPREALRTMPRPLWQDSIEVSAARNTVSDPAEVQPDEPIPAAMNTELAAPSRPTFIVNEDELRAAYEDTLDLSGETAILANDIAAASGETANLPAATVNLNAHALQAAAAATEEDSAPAEESATAIVGAEELRVDTTQLDYNLVDLDLTAQHVHMPSVLHERVIVKERRTNLVDVLKKAVEREPDRSDLRMKLLETYYAAAAANRHAFLEVVQKLARNRERLDDGEWEKIAHMGKQIAADTALFSSDSEAEDDKLADCA